MRGCPVARWASRLFVSAATVEHHIRRAMAKTGVSSREELAGMLPRHRRRSP
ncbi:LuxR C-terminal-related transcriptional regulator [Mycobacterium sp.]|uniref:LuxR C-terminal-related transcriptional regulator n=1 Tax=Mycobacterium sp. TaxID=1785 RepID=UPI003C74A547